jgi:predicted DNA-binding antitoxin AbrB/MazE fold protein
MSRIIRAIYENGMLRPLEPLDLAEQESVFVAIQRNGDRQVEPSESKVELQEEWLDKDAIAYANLHADPNISLADVRQALSGIRDSLADAVSEQRGEY